MSRMSVLNFSDRQVCTLAENAGDCLGEAELGQIMAPLIKARPS